MSDKIKQLPPIPPDKGEHSVPGPTWDVAVYIYNGGANSEYYADDPKVDEVFRTQPTPRAAIEECKRLGFKVVILPGSEEAQ